MSATEDVLHHQSGSGWVVLASRVPRLGGDTPELAARLVEHIDLSRPPAVLTMGEVPPAGLPDLVGDLTGLLAVEPALLSASEEAPPELAELSLIVLAGGNSADWVERLAQDGLGQTLLKALAQGAVLLVVGAAAGALGSWYLEGETVHKGLGWVAGSIILTGSSQPSESTPVRQLLAEQGRAYALALADHTLVALGPGSELEVWGESQPVIVFGPDWSSE
jgi:hypothetical protein